MRVDKLEVRIFDTRAEMGAAAALDIKRKFCELLAEKQQINVIFAAAPSQNEVLAALGADGEIDWSRIHAYHMDEYIGLAADAPQGFGNFLRAHLFDRVPLASVNLIDVTAKDADAEAVRYGQLLDQNLADVVVMGIGENGHIAFNDPPVADFCDAKTVKAVKLDEICRNQQVNDGCFASIDQVPTHALTVTVPALTRVPYLFCIIPAPAKAWAVRETLTGSIDEHCPASVLRTHDNAVLYLDRDSAAML